MTALYPFGLLLNVKTGRFHPISFQPAPIPGGRIVGRYDSQAHHTEGFDTRDEANAHIQEIVTRDPEYYATGREWTWDGEGVPAMVEFFGPKEAS